MFLRLQCEKLHFPILLKVQKWLLCNPSSEIPISWVMGLIVMVNLQESHLSWYISGLEPQGILKYIFLANLVEARIIDWIHKAIESS